MKMMRRSDIEASKTEVRKITIQKLRNARPEASQI
jgi:hypothetical protein